MSLKITPQIVLSLSLAGVSLAGVSAIAFADGWASGDGTHATNRGSIANTRHNLTLSYNTDDGGFGGIMDTARNNYGEVCVYCHTPHGANTQINAPLWNRTVNDAGNYSIYDRETTLGLEGRMSVPGPGSLTCLSCHDGSIAIDSVLNMPGSGLTPRGNAILNDQISTGSPNHAFLDQWAGVAGREGPGAGNHLTLGVGPGEAGNTTGTCMQCHSESQGDGFMPSFAAFVMGTDLRNDHVVGITFPTTFGPGIDYKEPDITIPGKWAFFDTNGSGFADKNEIRLYDSGDGPEVECASCHDPHGIPSNGAGTEFIPSFLRVSNSTPNDAGIGGPSGLCLTCHTK